jgi:hypothetical protein
VYIKGKGLFGYQAKIYFPSDPCSIDTLIQDRISGSNSGISLYVKFSNDKRELLLSHNYIFVFELASRGTVFRSVLTSFNISCGSSASESRQYFTTEASR